MEATSLKGWSKILHHTVKSNGEKQWLLIKVALLRNNKKKYWSSHETTLVFVYGDIFKSGSKNSASFKMELFATVDNGRVYNQWTVELACCCGSSSIFIGRIKIGWKLPCLENGIRYDFLFCRHVLHFFENANYFLFH